MPPKPCDEGPMEPNLWLDFAKTFGVAWALLLLLVWCMYRLGKLYITAVAKPMADRIIQSVDRNDEVVIEHTKILAAHLVALTEIRNELTAIKTKLHGG